MRHYTVTLQKIAEEKFLQDEESDLKRNLEEVANLSGWYPQRFSD